MCVVGWWGRVADPRQKVGGERDEREREEGGERGKTKHGHGVLIYT